MKPFDLENRLIDFAADACDIAEDLPSSRIGNHVAGQLIRSCTSPPANYGEVQAAESRKDFVHKLKVCLKELRETRVWLKFIVRRTLSDIGRTQEAQSECDELIRIFYKSIQTASQGSTKGRTTLRRHVEELHR